MFDFEKDIGEVFLKSVELSSYLSPKACPYNCLVGKLSHFPRPTQFHNGAYRPWNETNAAERKVMEAAFGVHFGCTSACLAVNKEGKTDVIANDSGERTTPCIVAFTDHDQAVGAAAKQGIIRNAQNSVCHVKKVLGRTFDDAFVTDYKRKSAVTVIDKNGVPFFEVEYKEAKKIFSPSQLAVIIYKKMLETAQSHGGSGIQDSVLTVPLYFSPEQRKAVSTAATEAGFNVLRLISEPVACVMAYDIGQTDNTQESQVLVFRLGGISTEASLVKVQNGMYRILASNTDHSFGGDRFTEELVNYLAQEFQRQNRQDIRENKRSMAKLWRGAENCKHTLSKLDNAHCAVESLYDGIDFNTKVSRARFESVVNDLIQKCTELIDKVLKEADISKDDVHKLILCGGGSCVPAVQRVVCGMFKNAEFLNQQSPEEVIAIGAAKQAGVLLGLEEEDIQMNAGNTEIECLSKDICIKSLNETGVYYHPIFTKFSPLHTRRRVESTLGEGQTSFVMEVCECAAGCQEDSEVVSLAKIVMRDLPAGCTVSSTFHLRREGSLHITCTESTSNRTESVTVEAES